MRHPLRLVLGRIAEALLAVVHAVEVNLDRRLRRRRRRRPSRVRLRAGAGELDLEAPSAHALLHAAVYEPLAVQEEQAGSSGMVDLLVER